MTSIKRITLTFSALLFCSILFAQPSDNAFWGGVTAKIKINSKWDASIEEQLRFNENFSNLNSAITEAGISYEVTDRISAKTTFRYYYNTESFNRYRYTGDLSYSFSEKGFPWRFKYRIRFQNTKKIYKNEYSTYIRNRFTVGYNLTKIADPYVAYEAYFKLNYVNKFTVNRFYVGLDWKILKDLELETYFMLESEFGEPKPKITRVFGIGFAYNFKL